MNKYKAVIFDLDGTLIDSMQIWRKVDAEFLGNRGIVVPEDLFDHLPNGNSFIQTAQYFKDRFGLADSVESIMQEWTDMVTFHYEHDIALKPGVRELLQRLHDAEVKIGLGTSNSLFLAQKVLKLNGIWHYFDAAVTGEQVKLGKPFPDIYLGVAAKLGLAPETCLVIEDTLTGVQAGKAAGMHVIAIYDEDSKPLWDKIKAAADDFILNHAELWDLL
ncbi:MAG: HAD family phosphatase [Candidatus Cloacimonadaceae bacterium]|nr:HAD family phosphatase [Candidatus Cloacimonadaceae bacterium]